MTQDGKETERPPWRAGGAGSGCAAGPDRAGQSGQESRGGEGGWAKAHSPSRPRCGVEANKRLVLLVQRRGRRGGGDGDGTDGRTVS